MLSLFLLIKKKVMVLKKFRQSWSKERCKKKKCLLTLPKSHQEEGAAPPRPKCDHLKVSPEGRQNVRGRKLEALDFSASSPLDLYLSKAAFFVPRRLRRDLFGMVPSPVGSQPTEVTDLKAAARLTHLRPSLTPFFKHLFVCEESLVDN